MGEIPQQLGRKLYVVGNKQHAKWAILACPCPNHERIDVNLMESRSPRWDLRVRGGRVTLWPSLWMPASDCGSHFWIRRGRVIWVRDDLALPSDPSD